MWAFLLWRRQKNLPPHKKLIMELDEGSSRHKSSSVPSPDENADDRAPAPWEKPADWWKK